MTFSLTHLQKIVLTLMLLYLYIDENNFSQAVWLNDTGRDTKEECSKRILLVTFATL